MCWLCRHLQEHLKQFTGDDISLEAKDQDELEFHYFKLHDYDNNNKLGELRNFVCENREQPCMVNAFSLKKQS